MQTSLDSKTVQNILADLSPGNLAYIKKYPGESDKRQPVHTVYGGAQLFKSTTTKRIGELSLEAMNKFMPNAETLMSIFDWKGKGLVFSQKVHQRVLAKIKSEAVEDFRIDFEDGYGNRSDNEEDQHAEQAASELAKGLKEKTISPYIGIRVKPFTEELAGRSIRTMDIFLTTLLKNTNNVLPSNFVITLAKITIEEQVHAFCEVVTQIEKKLGLPHNTIKIEFMVETLQSIFNVKGEMALLKFVDIAQGRCIAAHFGTYDYTAACNITANYQTMDHIACDLAKQVMQIALNGTGLMLSDGATNVMPVGDDPEVVHNAWRLSYRHIRHSLESGFYQGWDLHPAQLPARYAAVFSFFLEGFDSASARLKNFMEKAAQATLVGDVFDDAATGQGLLNYFLRGLACGAVTEQEVLATGLTLAEIRTRSFVKILKGRRSVT